MPQPNEIEDKKVVFFNPTIEGIIEVLEDTLKSARCGDILCLGIAYVKADGSPGARVAGDVANWAQVHGIVGGLQANQHFILRYAEKAETEGSL